MEWTPIGKGEPLPSRDEEVFVTTKDKGNASLVWLACLTTDGWVHDDGRTLSLDVIAWQQAPAPYDGGE